jgi:hypothetical protein
MPYPSADEFREILLTRPTEDVTSEYVFQGIPYVFEDATEGWDILREHLAANLGVDGENVYVVGSAKVGFSLSPNGFPRRFSEDSDIDIAVVDSALFDRAWHALLEWNYPRRYRLQGFDWSWARDRMADIYWGWFRPEMLSLDRVSRPASLAEVRDLRTSWFNAFQSLGRYPSLATRDVSGRLYRTLDHAMRYHMEGLSRIQRRLLGGS